MDGDDHLCDGRCRADSRVRPRSGLGASRQRRAGRYYRDIHYDGRPEGRSDDRRDPNRRDVCGRAAHHRHHRLESGFVRSLLRAAAFRTLAPGGLGFRYVEADDRRQYPADDSRMAGLHGRVGPDGDPALPLHARRGNGQTLLPHLAGHLLHDPVVAGRGGARRNDLFPPLSADARAGHLRGGRCRHAFPPFYPDRAAGGDYRADRRRDHVGRDVEPLVGAQFVCHGDL